jgi:hypothetical protein
VLNRSLERVTKGLVNHGKNLVVAAFLISTKKIPIEIFSLQLKWEIIKNAIID